MTGRNQDIKTDAGKLRMELLPPVAIKALSEVLTYGANKYGDYSWRTVETDRYIGALLRHMFSYMQDHEGIDEESGMPHIWHVLCNAAFLTELK